MPRRVYLDANILIYLLEGNNARQDEVRTMLAAHLADRDELHSSEFVVGECLRGAWRQGPALVTAYRRMFSNRAFITLAPVTLPLIERAAELGASLNMKLVDSLHVATAEACGCQLFITNDRGIRAPAGLALQSLSEA
ncbi:type II toxin-antitoxin system VapC family toxin [Rhizobium sp. CSW-27]|uniref:type II toxin-antitoxin system VapC family toxin n=1 Tax=Rhizobium sp. CSW-27 TaxID=2839985 RepID=UPI001C039A8A|nr:type II toxin-antitoxin system VapC family toxin [Rhizobium sp. CSW-27]MBT9371605.1 type II toxin-antitoxin system VapC family toxin [Rhizobium sp. CSW-27]